MTHHKRLESTHFCFTSTLASNASSWPFNSSPFCRVSDNWASAFCRRVWVRTNASFASVKDFSSWVTSSLWRLQNVPFVSAYMAYHHPDRLHNVGDVPSPSFDPPAWKDRLCVDWCQLEGFVDVVSNHSHPCWLLECHQRSKKRKGEDTLQPREFCRGKKTKKLELPGA